MNRKGDAWQTREVIGLFLLAVVAIALFTYWYGVQNRLADDSEIEACRLSVQAYAIAWVDTPLTDIHFWDIDCKRRAVVFTEEHVEVNGRKQKHWDPLREESRATYKKVTVDHALSGEGQIGLSQEVVHSVVASEMSRCWYQFLEGKAFWSDIELALKKKTACFLCSEIRFAPDFVRQALEARYDKNGQTFLEFLSEEPSMPYPRGDRDERPSYLEYIYLAPHVCDHAKSDWYTPGAGTCESQYLEKHLVGTKTWTGQEGLGTESKQEHKEVTITRTAVMDFTAMEPLRPRSYIVLFYQDGARKTQNDAGEDVGTTYSVILVPERDLSKVRCEAYLG